MTTIVKRATKGTPLTHAEVDANFDNLNTYKVEQNSNGAIVGSGSPVANGQTMTVRNAGAGNAGVYIQNSTSGSTLTDGVVFSYDGSFAYIWAYENIPLIFATNNVERVRINASGNMGIGGTPSQRLHVFGTGSVNPTVESSGSTTGQVGWNIKNNVANTATFSIYNSTQAAFGAVGSGEAFLYANSPGLTICTDTAGAPIKFATGTSNTERMRIDASGNLLCGTNTSPFGGDQTGFVNSNGTQTATWGVSATYGGAFIGSYSNHDLGLIANNLTRFKVYANGDTLNIGGGGLGYGTGSGGAVTQATSKSTAVTLNKPSGRVTMNNDALAAGAVVTFQLVNSAIVSTDTPVVAIRGGQTTMGTYRVWVEKVGDGWCYISVENRSAGSLSEALELNFNILKGSAT